MAMEELDAALDLSFAEMKRITPWGDSFPGFAPSGREVRLQVRRRHDLDPAHRPLAAEPVQHHEREEPAARETERPPCDAAASRGMEATHDAAAR